MAACASWSLRSPRLSHRIVALGFGVALALGIETVALAQPGAGGVQFLDQNTAGVPDGNELDDFFGMALATGDFDGDGFADLAVGAPGESLATPTSVDGQVTVIRGSSTGLDPILGAEVLNRNQGTLTGLPGEQDRMGYPLAAGDFNGDGIDDLAMGVSQGEVVVGNTTATDAGFVYVLWGTGTGLSPVGHLFLHRGVAGIPGTATAFEGFGYSLGVGDFDGNGIDDLVVGLPGADLSVPPAALVVNAGAVAILYGSPTGLDAAPPGISAKLWTINDLGIVAHQHDFFGDVVATGDFDADGFTDLAIGVYVHDFSTGDGTLYQDSGSVFVLRGSASGLTAVGSRWLRRGMEGLWGNPQEGDFFGRALAVGDWNDDGTDDLAIGVPYADQLVSNAGLGYIVYGSPVTGLTTPGSTLLTRPIVHGAGLPIASAYLTYSLGCGDFDGDGIDDLVIGGDDQEAWVVRGSSTGPVFPGLRIDHELVVPGDPAEPSEFGFAFAAADFDGNGIDDLAVGIPRYNATGGALARHGAVDVFYSADGSEVFSDGFESGDLSALE